MHRNTPNRGIILVLLLVTALAAMTAASALAESAFTPLPASQVDESVKTRALQTAGELLGGWTKGKYEPLSDQFSDGMRKALNPQEQEKAYAGLKAILGDFTGNMEFVEACTSPAYPGLVVYRFRGSFAGGGEKPEIRVVVNKAGKLDGFWVKPWNKDIR